MKKFLVGLIFGIALCAAAVWFYQNHQSHKPPVEQLKDAATQTGDFFKEKIGSLDLSTDHLKDELTRTGKIVRKKAEDAGHAVADATADARTTASIKGKLIADGSLSSLSISVNTTQGLVTLSGNASSLENIRKAVQIAWETDGVREVVSTIQIKP